MQSSFVISALCIDSLITISKVFHKHTLLPILTLLVAARQYIICMYRVFAFIVLRSSSRQALLAAHITWNGLTSYSVARVIVCDI